MKETVLTLTLPQPPVNVREVLRYMGCREATDEMCGLVDACVAMAAHAFDFRLCYATFPVTVSEDTVDLGFTCVHSHALAVNLKDCTRAVIFGATVGLEIDRLITKHGRLSPAKGLCLQALGAERIEALCDAFCEELAAREAENGCEIRPRFSPGYGDLPLPLQKDLFAVLDCSRRIGLTLNDSLLMSPTKSVTAMVGIKTRKEEPR